MWIKELMENVRNTWQDKDRVSSATGLLKLFAVQLHFFFFLPNTQIIKPLSLHADRQQLWGTLALPERIIRKPSLLGHMVATD